MNGKMSLDVSETMTENMLASALLKIRSESLNIKKKVQAGIIPIAEKLASPKKTVAVASPQCSLAGVVTAPARTSGTARAPYVAKKEVASDPRKVVPSLKKLAPSTPSKIVAKNQPAAQANLYRRNQVFDPSQAFSPRQFAAIQAAAGVEVASYATNTATSNQRLQYNMFPIVHTGSAGFQQMHASIQHHPAFAGANHSMHDLSGAGPDYSEHGNASSDGVRKEKIEDALKSQPQRGRKRVNLNETERLELTRTRNREHAKSTRVRKKARYQELLDNEQLLIKYRKADSVNENRRRCVVDFLAIREHMLRNEQGADESTSSEETRQVTNMGVISLGKKLQDVVENVASFAFHAETEPSGDTNDQSRMKRFDEVLRHNLSKIVNKAMLPLLSYKVRGSAGGITLSSGDTGFAEVTLAPAGHSFPPVLSGIVRFQFAPKSDKLRAVVWTLTGGQRSSERLNAQISHPSVVSLDPALYTTIAAMGDNEKSSEDEGNGPGMNI
jgi:hypothetical protein